jgi:SHS2 domain-containing protein
MYEIFEHTADLGLRVRAADLPQLFVEAARGLYSMIVTPDEQLNEQKVWPLEKDFVISGSDIEYLLFDWLHELLMLFESEHFVAHRFAVEFTKAGLTAHVDGEPLDENHHRLEHEVKAITYHGLRVERQTDGEQPGEWLAEVIVDI